MELLGLAHIAYHGAIDDETGLFFVADEDRIKSYSWWDTTKDAPQKQLVPEHTMNSSGFHGPLALLSNRRLARVGRKGKIGIWNLDDLPTHSTAKKGIIGGSMCKRGEEISTSRDDPEDIEVSAGSKPTSTITVADPFAIDIWHAHPNTSGSMITATDGRSLQYHCRAFDIEQAKCTTRYLGHGGGINQISTSRGDSNVFCTAGTDGFARLYDVRVPLPTITIEAAACQTNCGAAVVCHPDGIPYMFVSDKEAECITLWDIRAKAPVYDLATGNNVVDGLVWNDERNELFAATTCNYVDRNGYHHGYEQARIPRQETEEDAAKDSEGNEDDWVDDDDDEDEEDDEDRWEDTDQCWPGNAYHSETYFGHTFDSGDHRIYRYAFKADPDPLIIPTDGGATMDEEGSYW
ncbi:hypothetical protein D9611_001753 [Ephemerocybe angulata]|uniref:Uncharacterized protein n=1 Tax=Ephemerocybe angulata TaxID=980116 RepID=A0A8H5CIW4_9AGAR|nr:hypothetical protein D9611_001753 [Tulosesus angulatus]